MDLRETFPKQTKGYTCVYTTAGGHRPCPCVGVHVAVIGLPLRVLRAGDAPCTDGACRAASSGGRRAR